MSRILLAGVPAVLATPLVRALGEHHRVMLLEGSTVDLATCQGAAACDIVIQGLPPGGTEIDLIQHASQGVWNLLTTTQASRYVLLSSMRVYDGYHDGWHITEEWAPRPTVETGSLAPYLAEIASREITRERPIRTAVLRLGEEDHRPEQSSSKHDLDLVVDAVVRAVEAPDERYGPARWQAFHLAQGRFPASRAAIEVLGLAVPADQDAGPWPDPEWPGEPSPIEGLPIPRRIAIYGAGGPLGAITAATLAPGHTLRLSDFRSLAGIAAGPPQSTGAPLPIPPSMPHEEVRGDVADPDDVVRVAAGMDALINCTVIREDPAQAFRVNTIGAWNVMRAAVEAGIPRVVHTGPALILAPHPAGDTDGIGIPDDAPARPGDSLYFVSKYLGLEVCRVFAERYRIACPALHYVGFIDPESAARDGLIPSSFSVSWRDAGRAMAAAATVDRLPEPLTYLHVLADAPHGRYRNGSVKEVLGWTPQDRLDRLWHRRPIR